MIPELIIKCLLGKRIETTEGRQTREFNYVDNIIDALISLGKINPVPDNVMNIGSNKEIMISDLVQKIYQLSESSSELRIGALHNRPTEIWRMCADNTRISHALDWKPKVSFEEGLKNTIEWFKKYIDLFYNASSPLNQL